VNQFKIPTVYQNFPANAYIHSNKHINKPIKKTIGNEQKKNSNVLLVDQT